MEQYNVTGMSCAACSARVEKAVGKVPGVENCSVSLLTNSMGVEGTATVDAVIAAVEEAGYGATLKSAKNERYGMNQSEQNCAEDALKDRETPDEKASDRFFVFFDSAHVFLHGPYDVGLATSGISGRKSCGDGAGAAPVNDNRYGDQSEVFYQWLERHDP